MQNVQVHAREKGLPSAISDAYLCPSEGARRERTRNSALRFIRTCCGVTVAASVCGPAITKSAASCVVMCSSTTCGVREGLEDTRFVGSPHAGVQQLAYIKGFVSAHSVRTQRCY